MTKKKPSPQLSLAECTVLRFCCNARIDQLKSTLVAGVDPSSDLSEIAEVRKVRALFEKLTGYPLDRE